MRYARFSRFFKERVYPTYSGDNGTSADTGHSNNDTIRYPLSRLCLASSWAQQQACGLTRRTTLAHRDPVRTFVFGVQKDDLVRRAMKEAFEI
ncbi:hypothetical protein CBOM_05538 [Ceraceosorus bombacis]|uniref:Uncharacterized protein n=1 Tax=Ceraceosorus bombacis TaxID=401625 RepID=A0A0P1BSA2_9BASI|nr:hypothetical protein CBOM_05538 [Ceraceosorus bombacis]